MHLASCAAKDFSFLSFFLPPAAIVAPVTMEENFARRMSE